MGRSKVVTKQRRESRKALRGNQKTDENVTPFDNGNVENIGMAAAKYDRSPLVARNENQEDYLDALRNRDLVISTGSAGSGKTFLATAHAVDLLIDKEYDSIIVTRPVLTAEEELGFLPGTVMEKFMPFFRPVYDVLKKRMGHGFLQYCLREGIDKVEIAPLAYMRGRTFENSIVILDEAQNVTVSQMKLFLTRMGEGTKCIINGDVAQIDLPGHKGSGLVDLINRVKGSDLDIPVIEFSDEDSVRSEICSMALSLYK